jgi:hypothetical protein
MFSINYNLFILFYVKLIQTSHVYLVSPFVQLKNDNSSLFLNVKNNNGSPKILSYNLLNIFNLGYLISSDFMNINHNNLRNYRITSLKFISLKSILPNNTCLFNNYNSFLTTLLCKFASVMMLYKVNINQHIVALFFKLEPLN